MLEACRRNNVELLQEVIDKLSKTAKLQAKERVADVLNNAVDGVGNHALHLAATYGSCKRRRARDLIPFWTRGADPFPWCA